MIGYDEGSPSCLSALSCLAQRARRQDRGGRRTPRPPILGDSLRYRVSAEQVSGAMLELEVTVPEGPATGATLATAPRTRTPWMTIPTSTTPWPTITRTLSWLRRVRTRQMSSINNRHPLSGCGTTPRRQGAHIQPRFILDAQKRRSPRRRPLTLPCRSAPPNRRGDTITNFGLLSYGRLLAPTYRRLCELSHCANEDPCWAPRPLGSSEKRWVRVTVFWACSIINGTDSGFAFRASCNNDAKSGEGMTSHGRPRHQPD